jgi:hypothetical protein
MDHRARDTTSELSPSDRAFVEAQSEEIRFWLDRTAEATVEVGVRLIAVKERLPHGQWGRWLAAEFGMSDQTALNFMNVARHFRQNPKLLASASPAALYALAGGRVPAEVRQEFIERAEAGLPVRHKDVTEAIRQHRQRPASPYVQDGFAWTDELDRAQLSAALDSLARLDAGQVRRIAAGLRPELRRELRARSRQVSAVLAALAEGLAEAEGGAEDRASPNDSADARRSSVGWP